MQKFTNWQASWQLENIMPLWENVPQSHHTLSRSALNGLGKHCNTRLCTTNNIIDG